ncbi:MAG: serine/threonine-protein phosphatase [Victivallaceae bacterium]|nr:serine/threonine-protein phosphatase [Victivallaceae bacterium]
MNSTQAPEMVKFQLFSATHQGLVRKHNEDAFAWRIDRDGRYAYAIVADGIGGHEGGEVASEMTCRRLADAFDAHADRIVAGESAAVLRESIAALNSDLFGINAVRKSDMGCALVAGIFAGGEVFSANVGDSRFYEWSPEGELLRRSTDHTLLERMRKVSRQVSDRHGYDSILTSTIGLMPDLQIQLTRFVLKRGSKFLLNSDGLTHMLSQEAIATILREKCGHEAAHELVRRALLAGGGDNVTVILIQTE